MSQVTDSLRHPIGRLEGAVFLNVKKFGLKNVKKLSYSAFVYFGIRNKSKFHKSKDHFAHCSLYNA